MVKPLLAALDTAGQIEYYLRDITDLQDTLRQTPLWRPAAVLDKQAAEAVRIVEHAQHRPDKRLIATIIGPSGAGKSTVFNALAGRDDLSPSGHRRPTTRGLVVLAEDAAEARFLLGDLADDQITIANGSAEHIVLVDTPDTDSTQSPAHIDLLMQTVSRSDVLICVFDAQNPLRRDHADFMAPLVRQFHGASLIAVANKCDRLSGEELADEIGPALEDYLADAWDTKPDAVLLVSARGNLQRPQWDSQTTPRHALDQFAMLKELLFGKMNQPTAGRNHRIANAAQIRNYILEHARQTAGKHRKVLARCLQQVTVAEQQALKEALVRLQADDRQQLISVQVRLYQALAQRWLGPVGWLVAIWSRLIVFGMGLTALLRFGNPIRQVWGLVSSWRRLKQSRNMQSILEDQSRADAALDIFQNTLLVRWPDIAAQLVNAQFSTAVLTLETSEQEQAGQALERIWANELDHQITRTAKRLSHILLQLIFNLPCLALMGYVGWLTVRGFISQNYLSSDFFLHALLTIAVVLFLSFFIFQGVVRLSAGRGRIQRRAFQVVEGATTQQPARATRKIADQIAKVLSLAEGSDAQ